MKELQTTLTVYKKEGETPLECLDRLRAEHPEYKDAVLSYAGRLDPMAEGAILILVNEANKEREKYLGLDKEYEVDILFGVSTDTGDVLGKIVSQSEFVSGEDRVGTRSPQGGRDEDPANAGSEVTQVFVRNKLTETEYLEAALESFVGPLKQKYPHYSSRTVEGKPLFQWAREGRLAEIEIPERSSEIYSIEMLDTYGLSAEEILKSVQERVDKVKGNFRQEEIITSWKLALEEDPERTFSLAKIKVACSSGTYMRTLAESVAQKLGTTAIAWKIKRTLLFSRSKVL